MHRFGVWTRTLTFLCILAVLVYGCCSQSEKCISQAFDTQTAHFSLQIPRAHARPQNQLNEGQWVPCDDSAQAHNQERRGIVLRRSDLAWLLSRYLGCLLIGFAYLVTGVFHRSSSPTYGLLRIVTFLLHMDGKKGRPYLFVIT
jgi:hypothetical protein